MNQNASLSLPPVDPKDPRFRYTFADVAMKVANDGPMYMVIFLIGVLAMKGITSGQDSVMGVALALLGRSRPPDDHSKKPFPSMNLALAGVLAVASLVVACV